ncbi:unnamed protein product [Dicrocoelium dendriticum]|nr:unnamed protein product [Dicrocoelium dendriticum]
MAQNSFLAAFRQIDRDGDGVIKISDLEAYANRETVAPDFVRKWRTLFDPQNTGQITFSTICQTLGLNPKLQKDQPKMDVIYQTNMTDSMRDDVFMIAKQHYNSAAPEASLNAALRQLDETFGRLWSGHAVHQPPEGTQKAPYLVYSCDAGKHKFLVSQTPHKKKACGKCKCC